MGNLEFVVCVRNHTLVLSFLSLSHTHKHHNEEEHNTFTHNGRACQCFSGSADIFHITLTSIIHQLEEWNPSCIPPVEAKPATFWQPNVTKDARDVFQWTFSNVTPVHQMRKFTIHFNFGWTRSHFKLIVENSQWLCLLFFPVPGHYIWFSDFSMTCLLKVDRLGLQHELAADGRLIIPPIQSRISWVNNLAQHPHYISPYPKPVTRWAKGHELGLAGCGRWGLEQVVNS